MYQFVFTPSAQKDLADLPKPIAKRIAQKLRFFAAQENPLQWAKKLNKFEFGQYRFRVGDYRIVFDIDQKGYVNILLILRIKHRRDVYKP